MMRVFLTEQADIYICHVYILIQCVSLTFSNQYYIQSKAEADGNIISFAIYRQSKMHKEFFELCRGVQNTDYRAGNESPF